MDHRITNRSCAGWVLSLFILASACGLPIQQREERRSGWQTVCKDGVHWLVTPQGTRFYSKGVNFVDGGIETPASLEMKAYYWKNFFPVLEEWHQAVGTQLAAWGFNTRGGWSDPSPKIGLALTVELDLGRRAGVHWFDPFDPAMDTTVDAWARTLTRPYLDDPLLIGYFTDNEVGWWNSPLFVWFLNKGWENHTKRLLWQLLYDEYEGTWDRLLADWVPDANTCSFEDLKKSGAVLRLRPLGRGIRLVDRFLYLCAHRYYSLMHRALRAAHPNALILGDRLPLYYHQDAVRAVGDFVDVLSTNYNVDTPDGWIAPYYFEGLHILTNKPVLVTEYFFAAMENRSGNMNLTQGKRHAKPGHLMTVATQKERAQGVAQALKNFARFPNIVGVHWFQYCDEPLGGREDGEDYNFGLVDTANRPYEEVTEVFEEMNPLLEVLHSRARPFPDTPHHVSCGRKKYVFLPGEQCVPIEQSVKAIDLDDQTLTDWDKETTRLTGLKTKEPYVPFGDVHLAWRPEGLYIATIAHTYVDPTFLAYDTDFPLSEAFQLHLVTQIPTRTTTHAAFYLVPRLDQRCADGFELEAKAYTYRGTTPVLTSAPVLKMQRINKSLPHVMLEAFVSATSLGVQELRNDMKLNLGLAVTNFYREFTMCWPSCSKRASHVELPSLTPVLLQGQRP